MMKPSACCSLGTTSLHAACKQLHIDDDALVEMSRPSGILNNGNNCYANTTLQCLASCAPFVDAVRSCASRDIQLTLVIELDRILRGVRDAHARGSPMDPRVFMNAVEAQQGPRAIMDVHEQNDMHEFLLLLLDLVSGVARDHPQRRVVAHHEQASSLIDDAIEKRWRKLTRTEPSPILDAVRGMQVSQIVCGSCGHKSNTFQTCLDISLDIDIDRASGDDDQLGSIDDMLDVYTDPESVIWNCDRCKASGTASKTVRFARLPPVMMIFIKRFDATQRKIDSMVSVPLVIDMGQHTIKGTQDRGAEYTLQAIGCHSGGYNGGHYHALCNVCPDDGQWDGYGEDQAVGNPCKNVYDMNDSCVRRLQRRVDSREFYGLFYVRSN